MERIIVEQLRDRLYYATDTIFTNNRATNPKRNGTKKSSYKPNIGLSCFRTLSTSLRLTTIKSSPQLSGKSMMDFPLFRTAFLMAFFTFGKVGSMLKYKQWRIAIVSVSSSTKKRTVTFM